jgi:hypothetical protein
MKWFPVSGVSDQELATARNELMMLKLFRLVLPTALLASFIWMFEFSDSARQSVFNSLGANANHIVFIVGILIVVGLYWFMGVYERKIMYENRHTNRQPAF